MHYQGVGIYRKDDQFVYVYLVGSAPLYIAILPSRQTHLVSLYVFEGLGYTLYLPAEGRSLDQMLADHPELLL